MFNYGPGLDALPDAFRDLSRTEKAGLRAAHGSASEIYPKTGQSLHYIGLLSAAEAADLKAQGLSDKILLLNGISSLEQLTEYVVPMADRFAPDPRFVLAWLRQENGDVSGAVIAAAGFLTTARPLATKVPPSLGLPSRIWLKAYIYINETNPGQLTVAIYEECEKHLRQDPADWVQLISCLAKQGDESKTRAIEKAQECQREYPQDKNVNELVSRLSSQVGHTQSLHQPDGPV
jgi:hypothetical protein